jgi:PAS domain S-box-containing protein
MPRPNPSLRVILAAAFGGIALLAALAASLLAGAEASRRLRAQILEEMAGRARQSAALLDREMFARWRDLLVAAELPPMRDAATPPELRRVILSRLHDTYRDYALLTFIAPDGRVLADSRGLLEGADASGREVFRRALSGPVVEDVHDAMLPARLLGVPGEQLRLVELAAPVRNAAGRLVGVLGAHLDWRRAAEAVASSAPGDPEGVLILGRDGRVLLGPPGLQGRALATPTGRGGGPFDGGGTMLTASAATQGYRDFPGLGWVVLVRQDGGAAMAPVRAMQLRILGLGLLAALVAALLGWWAAWWLARPLRHLAAAAERLRLVPGDAAPLPPPGGFAEAAMLTRALDGMLRRRREAEAGLRQANEALEGRAAAGTTELATQQSELRRIYDRTPAAFHSVDDSGRIIHVSDYWLTFLGYAREEVIGRQPSDFMPPECAARWRAVFEGPTGPPDRAREFERRIRRRDGTVVEVLMRTRPEVDAAGRFLCSYTVLLDLTARNRAEARLREAQKLEALGRIAGGVSHDINNMLQAMTGALHLLNARPEDPARVRRHAGAALAAVERGASITRRMLAFARQDQLQPTPVAVASLFEGLAAVLRGAADPHIALEIAAPPGLPPVLADRAQLDLVLFNLALNGRDAMPEGGHLRLAAALDVVAGAEAEGRVAAAHPQGLAPGRYLRFTVEDSGAGMDAATLARATEPFFTTKEAGQGTGLGLAMAHGFAVQSGGALALASTPGKGSVVTLWLPAAAEEEAPAAATPPAA